MTRQKLIKLLQSGNFSIHYDENESGRIIKDRHVYGKGLSLLAFDGKSDGYIPVEVELLVIALGGKVDSV